MPVEKSFCRPQSQRLAIRDALRGSRVVDDASVSSDTGERPASRWLFLTRTAVHLVRPPSHLSSSSQMGDERASMLASLNWHSSTAPRALHNEVDSAVESMHRSALATAPSAAASARYLPPRLVRDHYPVEKLLLPELSSSSTSKVRRNDALQAASFLEVDPLPYDGSASSTVADSATKASTAGQTPHSGSETSLLRSRTQDNYESNLRRTVTVSGEKEVNRSAFSKQILHRASHGPQPLPGAVAASRVRPLNPDDMVDVGFEDESGDREMESAGEYDEASSPSKTDASDDRKASRDGARVRFKITRPSPRRTGVPQRPQHDRSPPLVRRPHPPALKGASVAATAAPGELRLAAISPSAPTLDTPQRGPRGSTGGAHLLVASPMSPRRSSRANFLDRMSVLKSSLQRIVLEVTGEFEFYRDADQLRALHEVVGSVDDVYLSREYRTMHPMQSTPMDRDYLATTFRTTPSAAASSRPAHVSSANQQSKGGGGHRTATQSRVAVPLSVPPPLQTSGLASHYNPQRPSPHLDDEKEASGLGQSRRAHATGTSAPMFLSQSVLAPTVASTASRSPATGTLSPTSPTRGRRESAYYHQLVENRRRNAAATEGESLYAVVELMEARNARLLSKLLPGHEEALEDLSQLGLL